MLQCEKLVFLDKFSLPYLSWLSTPRPYQRKIKPPNQKEEEDDVIYQQRVQATIDARAAKQGITDMEKNDIKPAMFAFCKESNFLKSFWK